MKVQILIGPRDEEKITMVKYARKNLPEDEWKEFIFDRLHINEQSDWYDAIYYANKNRDWALVDQSNDCYDLAIEEPRVAEYDLIDVA